MQLTSVFLPGEFHGQRSLVADSSWVASSRTQLKQLSTHACTASLHCLKSHPSWVSPWLWFHSHFLRYSEPPMFPLSFRSFTLEGCGKRSTGLWGWGIRRCGKMAETHEGRALTDMLRKALSCSRSCQILLQWCLWVYKFKEESGGVGNPATPFPSFSTVGHSALTQGTRLCCLIQPPPHCNWWKDTSPHPPTPCQT